MIDVIIPCYNSHKTIEKTLYSIGVQSSSCKITLVNDAGEPYDDIIKRFNLDIQQINCKENKGPGHARNVGMDNTCNPYILFIDSDDCLMNPFALSTMSSSFTANTIQVTSNIIAENEDHTTRSIKRNANFLHGKMYQRKFLEENSIRFNEVSCCEDDSFNVLCRCNAHKKGKQIKFLEYDFYAWLYNRESLGRKNVAEWEHLTVIKYQVENLLWAFNQLEDDDYVAFEKTKSMLHILLNVLHADKFYPQYAKQNFISLKKYYNMYKELKGYDYLIDEVYDRFNLSGDKQENLKYLKRCLEALKND